MSENHIIKVQRLCKKYNRKRVLDIETLNIETGVITGIIGPSGAGKTTLLRLMNLLENPTSGSIEYFGEGVPSEQNSKLRLQRRMAFVFQKPVMLDASVYENVALPLLIRKLEKEKISEKVIDALTNVGLKTLLNQNAKTLSGGEAQRVAIARAMVIEPDILLLDEPTANLDPSSVNIIESQILEMNRKSKTTVVMITHNIHQTRRIADNVLFFYDGRLIEEGDVQKVLDNSANEITKQFVEGKMVY